MKRGALISGLFILLLLLSTFLVTKFFVFDSSIESVAQELKIPSENLPSSSPYDSIKVFLEQPIAGSEILGQTNIRVNITNIDEDLFADTFTNFVVELYKNSAMTDKVGDMYITTPFHQEIYDNGALGSHWLFGVDTLDFENGDYYFHFRAFGDFDGDSEVTLYNMMDGNNIFGPITINNQAQIYSPRIQTLDAPPISGTDIILSSTLLAADAFQAIYSIKDYNGNDAIIPIIINDSINSTETYSKWETHWDSTSVPNGQYSLSISFITLSGNDAFVNDERVFIVYNEEDTQGYLVCTNPIYDCPPWPDCSPSDIFVERECVSTNCNPEITTNFIEQCPATDLSDPDVNDTTITNTNTSNTNTATTTSPNSDDNNTTLPPPPEEIPVITMSYPEQGDYVSGAVILKANIVGQVDQLEFLYQDRDNGIEKHIGQAQPSTTNTSIWQMAWNTDDIPNGEYYLFSRAVTGEYFYLSNFVEINIDHNNSTFENPPYVDVPTDVVNDDGDMFSNVDEILLDLDPNYPDTIIDSEQINTIIDEKIALGEITLEQGDTLKQKYVQIVFDQPTKSGELRTDKLKISKVDNISPRIGANNLVFSGIGPANSYVTIYIYSDPIVVTTKTDSDGNFTYTLDKNLLDGEHEVYVTITDDTGKIVEKSSPLTFFVSRAQAVTEEEYLRGDVNIDTERSEVVNNFILPALIMVGVLILVVGGVFVANRKKPV